MASAEMKERAARGVLEMMNHIPPVDMQPAEEDMMMTVGRRSYVAQIQSFHSHKPRDEFGGQPVHYGVAMLIAAEWHADYPNMGYGPFAVDGTITQELIDSLSQLFDSSWDNRALWGYVKACQMKPGTVWTVGHNIPGYLPESDVTRTFSRDDAMQTLRSDAEYGNDAIEHQSEEEGEECTDCDACTNEGLIGGVMGAVDGEANQTTGNVSVTLTDGGGRIVYWATVNDRPMPVEELIDYDRC